MHYLTLFLSGPLQAWGIDSRFDLRETLPFPSRSAVSGMLLAASGDSGPQNELLAQLAEATFTVYTFGENKKRLRDFHMVGNGYNEKDPWQKLLIPKKSDGTAAGGGGGGAKLTYRYYLQNSAFCVVIGLPSSLANKFAEALQNPVYDLYLGRKCCVPDSLIYQGIFPSETDAVSHVAQTYGLNTVKRIRDASPDEQDAIRIPDVPIEFGLHRKYRERMIVQEPFVINSCESDQT